MLSKVLLAAVVAGLVLEASAECQNGCNKQGTCGANDQCQCYNTHRGNACEKRICPYGLAWTTTPNGDLNYNGNRNDASVYSWTQAFTSRSHVVTQENKGGSWEMWPANSQNGEGHHSMECSNAGLCDVSTGTCKCFEGFEGSACQRMSCPNQCSGHGRCLTIGQRISKESTSSVYTLWDRDMARSCLCDPGYTGNDCTMRMCPRGDDPLTKTHQTADVQTIEIYSNDFTVADQAQALSGTFTLTFKSLLGLEFTTDPITFTPHTHGSTTVSAAVQSALTALPNGVIPSVTVTQGYCEAVVPGAYDKDYAVVASSGSVDLKDNPTKGTDWAYLRCPGGDQNNQFVFKATTLKKFGDEGASVSISTAASYYCLAAKYPRCTRIYVKFSDAATSGQQNLMKVDISNVKQGSDTNTCAGGSPKVHGQVIREPTLYIEDATYTSNVGLLAAAATTANTATDTLTGTFSGASYTFAAAPGGTWTFFPAGAKVKIECTPSGGSAKNMGTYVVATTVQVANAAALAFTESLTDPHAYCVTGSVVTFTLQTSFIYGPFSFANSPVVSLGSGVKIGATAVKSAVASTTYSSTLFKGFLLLEENPAGITANIALAESSVTLAGASTQEAAECSDHGKCDYSTGLCSCFKGYQGEACQLQNALWLGA